MILVIDGKHYRSARIEELSLRRTMELQRELALHDISSAKTMNDIRKLLVEYAELPRDKRGGHPEAPFLVSLTIWASRVSAGEDISLLDAVDVPPSAISWIDEPSDNQAPQSGKGAPRRTGDRKPKGKPRATSTTP